MKKYGFGADVGGTTCKIGLFSMDGSLIDKWEIPTDKTNGGENILKDVAKSVSDKMAEKGIAKEDVEGIGIGVPGPVTDDGVVHTCVNLGWGEKNVVEELQKITGFTVKAGNDANVAALGELVEGVGKGKKSLVILTLGTGVGGGVVINGKIIHGADGAGGEIGHMNVNSEEKTPCNCGNCGCLEQYVSATGIARMARMKVATCGSGETLLQQKSLEELTAKDVFDAAKLNDEVALEIVERVGEILGDAMARVAVVANPSVFVLGGGVSKAGDILTCPIQDD